MVKFDDAETMRLLHKKKLGLNACFVIFALLIISAVLAAVLARSAYSDDLAWSNHLYALAFAAGCLVALLGVIIFYVAPTGRALKLAVNRAIADGLLARKDMFAGGGKIDFVADYSGDTLTLSRKGYTGEIAIDPARLKAEDKLGGAGAKIGLDLANLKSAPSVYSAVGGSLWLFLQAYYALHGEENGVTQVTVTDNTGKTPVELQVFGDGAALKNADKNYFIKKGLVK